MDNIYIYLYKYFTDGLSHIYDSFVIKATFYNTNVLAISLCSLALTKNYSLKFTDQSTDIYSIFACVHARIHVVCFNKYKAKFKF